MAIWPVTGQGFQNTKWPAVPYSYPVHRRPRSLRKKSGEETFRGNGNKINDGDSQTSLLPIFL